MFNEQHILRTTTVLTLFLSLALIMYRPSVGLGLLCGGLTSILAFRLMILDATKLLYWAKQGLVNKRGAARHTLRGFMKRCLLYSIALAIATLNPYMNFLSTLLGLLLPRVAIVYHLLRGRTKRAT